MGKETYRFAVRVRETGEVIDTFGSFPYAISAINRFEEEDRADGCYQANFYEVATRATADDEWITFIRKPKTKHNNTAVTVKLPFDLVESAKAKAERTGVTFASAIKMLLSDWVSKE